MKNDRRILFIYCIPYLYIAMWLDITYKTSLPYVLLPYIAVIVFLLIMRVVLGKAGKHKIAFKGFILNMTSSWLCILLLQRNNLDRWHGYFGPFFPFVLICIVIVAELFIYAIKSSR